MKKRFTFEDSMEKLQTIVEKLEGGNESLESSLNLFEEGTTLALKCYKTLSEAEQKIIELSEIENNSKIDLEK